jgi:hypothetical protein
MSESTWWKTMFESVNTRLRSPASSRIGVLTRAAFAR